MLAPKAAVAGSGVLLLALSVAFGVLTVMALILIIVPLVLFRPSCTTSGRHRKKRRRTSRSTS
ncbi:MAG: hypothetical protein JOZ19_09905 [Rubrobacter sp.]|nr:hypothetical protein [Rubrobacter sp.]